MANENGVKEPAEPANKAIAPRPDLTVDFDRSDPASLYMNPGTFNQLLRVAKLLSSSALVPAHLRSTRDEDKTADCFLVAGQAMRWGIDPFAAAQCCFVTAGKVGYEGKLIAALINSRPEIETRLNYEYVGAGDNRRVRVTAKLRGESKERAIEGTVADWKTKNEKWLTMQDQMLAYRGAREWARRHLPEAILGIYSDDEINDIVTLGPESVRVSVDSLSSTPPVPVPPAATVTVDSLNGGTVSVESGIKDPPPPAGSAPGRTAKAQPPPSGKSVAETVDGLFG